MLICKKNVLTSALIAAGMLSVSTQAQEEGILEEIVIQGVRASLLRAQEVKRESRSIVEVISAEDIGKLPDPSIAETISRLPGVAARRVDGRASAISIRGLSEDYSATTFNGREQVSIGDNRGVDFYMYPAEIISGVAVYKTPEADLITQGVAGVVDLQSVKPLDYGQRVVNVSGSYEMNSLGRLNPDISDTGHRLTLTYVDQFRDDTLGVALAINTMDSPNQEERWEAWGGTEWPTDAEGNIILGGAKPYVRSSSQKRDTVMGVLTIEPNDRFSVTADALYIDYMHDNVLRGIEIPATWGAAPVSVDSIAVADGVVTHGRINNSKPVMRNDYNLLEADLYAFGVNTEYRVTEDFLVAADISTSSVSRDYWGLETYSGTGRGDDNGPRDTIEFEMNAGNRGVMFTPGFDYSDYNMFLLGGPLSWGGGNTLHPDPDDQDGFLSTTHIEDEMNAIKIYANHTLNQSFFSGLTYGVNYSSREKSKVDSGTFLTLPQYPEMLPVPEQYRLGTVSLDFIGMGDMIAYDAFRLYKDGVYTETKEDLTATFRATNSWQVEEDILTAFVKADFDYDISNNVVLRGNVGLQAVRTDQSSVGNAATNGDDGRVVITPVTGGATYTDVLPSLNTVFNLYDNHYIRASIAETMSRSRMDRMNASMSFGFNELFNNENATIENSPWNADGGNPELRPQIARTYDLSYEYYFPHDGYVAFAAYYKDLKSWQVVTRDVYDFSDVTPPNNQVAEFDSGYIYKWDSADGGSLHGYEISTFLPGGLISEYLEGYGLVANASYVDADIEVEGQQARIPGLSRTVYNLTAFYEKHGWQLRTSFRKRDGYPAELGYDSNPVVIGSSTLIDAQIGYDFSESSFQSMHGLTLSLQAYNLTNEPFVAFASGDPRLVRDYQVYGRNYLLTASYTF